MEGLGPIFYSLVTIGNGYIPPRPIENPISRPLDIPGSMPSPDFHFSSLVDLCTISLLIYSLTQYAV